MNEQFSDGGRYMREYFDRPWIHLFGSTFCNMDCPYCSQNDNLTHSPRKGVFEEETLLNRLSTVPPTHLYLSGGEPLIQQGIRGFVERAISQGHVVSFDTNLHQPLGRIEELVKEWPASGVGFFNVSHHFLSGVSLEELRVRVSALQERGFKVFVKYVGVPEEFDRIAEMIAALESHGIGATVTILQGVWKGRRLPDEYTMEETVKLLNMVRTKTHGLQVFGGIIPKQTMCRGGADFVAYNMVDDRRLISCCHGNCRTLSWDDTCFGAGGREKRSCSLDVCLGDIMILGGMNGLIDEVDPFERLCNGGAEPPGAEAVLAFVGELIQSGVAVVNEEKYRLVSDHLSG